MAWTGKDTTAEQTAEGIKLTAHVDAASSQAIFDTDRVCFIGVAGNKMMVKSPGVIVPMSAQTSVVEFELVKQTDCMAPIDTGAVGRPEYSVIE